EPAQEKLKVLIEKKYQDNSVVFDRDGEKIGEFFNSYHVYVPYKEIPKHMRQAILAIEDRNFFTHKGIDPRGILRAALSYLKQGSPSQGASTITQQIVRNFVLTPEKTIQRKLLEMRYA